MITDPPKNCQKDWSLKIFGEMGALDSERWEYPMYISYYISSDVDRHSDKAQRAFVFRSKKIILYKLVPVYS